PYRLVIDCLRPAPSPRATAGPTTSPKAVLVPSRPVHPPALPSPLAAFRNASSVAQIVQPPGPQAIMPAREPDAVEARTTTALASVSSLPAAGPAVTVPSRNLAGGISLARQLGLGVSRIVIDPGHGGHDPGAKGPGITEAELVLDIALRLEKLPLAKAPGVEVFLTRRGDEFVPLQERTAMANRESADLFLSIHANASGNPQARGIETYFLNFATNLSAAAVAARENATSTLAMGELPDFVKAIATNNKVDESRDFATHVQRAMAERLRP